MLKCNWSVITVAMPLSNSNEVFVGVVYCGFPTISIIFILFDGSTMFFSRCGTLAKFVQLKTLFFNFARLGPWTRDYIPRSRCQSKSMLPWECVRPKQKCTEKIHTHAWLWPIRCDSLSRLSHCCQNGVVKRSLRHQSIKKIANT